MVYIQSASSVDWIDGYMKAYSQCGVETDVTEDEE